MLPPAATLREAIDGATVRLAEAGVPSARNDAELLAAHALGVSRSELMRLLVLGGSTMPDAYAELVSERVRRVPLQHLTGLAPFRDLELTVGPGVFVPRPETESVAEAAIVEAIALAADRSALVVDLCTGSAAIALAVATEVPLARVIAVEVSEHALAWAAANVDRVARGRVELRQADVCVEATRPDALADLVGLVDVVVSNPPYVPPDQVPVDPEVRDHDPQIALYGGGPDGLAVPRAVIALAARLLRPRGLLVMEHADVQGQQVVAAFPTGSWSGVEDHPDLGGRPRHVTARRIGP